MADKKSASSARLVTPIAIPTDPDYFTPLFNTLLTRKNKGPFTLHSAHVEVVLDALWCAQLFQGTMLELTDARPGRERRMRAIVNRLLGRPETASFRGHYDKATLKRDWDDLRAGRPNPRYVSRPQCGLPSQTARGRCPLHERWEWRCRGCWARREPVELGGGLTADEAVTAMETVYGFPSWEACRRALHRAAAKGLPNTREPL